jgi:hypothetical protein
VGWQGQLYLWEALFHSAAVEGVRGRAKMDGWTMG